MDSMQAVRWLREADEVIAVSRLFEKVLAQKGIKQERLRWIPNAISEENLRSTYSGEPLREFGSPEELPESGRNAPNRKSKKFCADAGRLAVAKTKTAAISGMVRAH